ncbi:Uncharacterized conserved protein, UPF0335 family [Poseidonocella pacifica]|uniref:UPF0335 protein SAMN05421688_1997 n=1 Tax=Poseidonocella pacifica TaxID=871651 RepID=A0A1I0X8I6_9RHOB|nr:DUF2312 domain-containing protein [Poseidonocella pacifica]SFA97345.1 Uncharacterized conserved protein, UPF0335 family [Poseidonocella pacifica]
MSDFENDAQRVTGDQLRAYVERIERLEEEKKEVADQIKEVFAELKAEGFDAKAIREILKRRKQDPDDVAEQEAVIDLYMSALGMT